MHFRRYADCFNVNGTLVPHHHAAAPHTDGKAGHNSHTSWHKKGEDLHIWSWIQDEF